MKHHIQTFIKSIRSHKKTLLLLTVAVLITILVHTWISIWLSRTGNFYIPSIGTIHVLNVEVYGKDIQVQNGQKFIDWGVVYPGTAINRTFNVTSISNIDAFLIIKAANWTFFNSEGRTVGRFVNNTEYMTLEPDLNETLMHPNQTLELTVTLSVDNSPKFIEFLLEKDVKKFSFDMHIYLSETR